MADDRITKLERQLQADPSDKGLREQLNNVKLQTLGEDHLATFQGKKLHEDQFEALQYIAKQYGQPAEDIVKYLIVDNLYIDKLTLKNPTDNKVKLNIPLSLIKLSFLDCSFNRLTQLTIPQGIPLQYFGCNANQLRQLNIPLGVPLTSLDCSVNQLATLIIPKETPLQKIRCGSNQLTQLTIPLGTPLTELDCQSNRLATLNIPTNTPLQILHCGSNRLATLIIPEGTPLQACNCVGNKLKTLTIPPGTPLVRLFSSPHVRNLSWLSCFRSSWSPLFAPNRLSSSRMRSSDIQLQIEHNYIKIIPHKKLLSDRLFVC